MNLLSNYYSKVIRLKSRPNGNLGKMYIGISNNQIDLISLQLTEDDLTPYINIGNFMVLKKFKNKYLISKIIAYKNETLLLIFQKLILNDIIKLK